MPELGDNAVYKLARAVVELERFSLPAASHELLGEPTLSVVTFSGGMNVNSVPDFASAGIDIRTVPGLREDEAIAAVDEADRDDVSLDVRVKLPPVVTDPFDPWVGEVFYGHGAADRRATRRRAGWRTSPTRRCSRRPTARPPTIICGPGYADQAHQTDEHCSIANLEAPPRGSSRSPGGGAGSELPRRR